MDQKLVIGMDFGSDSVRAVLVDVKDGREYANAVCNYPRWMKGLYCDSSQDRYRQHARDYVEAMTEVLRQVIAACPDPRTIAAISVDTTASTPCLTDDKMVPLCLKPGYEEDPDAMFVLWKDHTGTKESAEIEALCAQSPVNYACHTGGSYSPENFWAKVLHLLRSSEKLQADAYSVIELCDFIPAVLTGVSSLGQMRMSHCVAGAKWMWAEEWGGFPPEEFFRKLDPILLPVLRHLPSSNYYCSEAFGHLSAEWASRLGLSTDVLVGVGNVDSHSGAVGAGVAEGRMVMNLGTSACYMGVVPREKIGGKDIPGVFGQVDGMILQGLDGIEVGLSSFGDAFAWLRRLLSWAAPDKADDILPALTAEAEKLPQREDAPLATDHFNGRRCPFSNGSLTASLQGLKLFTSAPELYYAIVEATCFATRAILDHLTQYGVPIDDLVACGGVSQKSPFVMQMMSDVCGRTIHVSATKNGGAMGAAIHAAVVAGCWPDVPSAQRAMCPPVLRTYTPDPSKAAIFDKRYQRYRAMVQFNENV